MTRRLVCFSAILVFCCAVFAQAPPAPASPSAENPPANGATPATGIAAAPGATSAASPEVQQFQKIEDKWDDAVNARDQYSLELVLSPLFVGISATGDITTRNQQLAGVISEPDKTVRLEQRVVAMRMLGDIAVANGTYTLHHKVGSNEVDERGIFTHVFERQRNNWVCVNSQRTVLRQDNPNAKTKKKSESELPFHFPLFSK
ncbi:MAG TPA: nuclear transport factor 2 family protein [Terracidiphilus sp.]|jgi:ketosteroid isomerase-like protein|nr:nuclear transport factor 2 family protein [Terracidiphilus sp.]